MIRIVPVYKYPRYGKELATREEGKGGEVECAGRVWSSRKGHVTARVQIWNMRLEKTSRRGGPTTSVKIKVTRWKVVKYILFDLPTLILKISAEMGP
jgi:hypothetical protein